MELSSLNAISPVDGRYRKVVEKLAHYFSEGALMKYRVLVEVEYFIALCNLPVPQLTDIDKSIFESLRGIYKEFSQDDARKVKDIEAVTNHDVKAVEYFLKEKNNTAIPCALKGAWVDVLQPVLDDVIENLNQQANQWKDVPMLARTHGQPASPTRLGKEIFVFVERLKKQKNLLETIPFSAKFGGATGNFNAHVAAYPEIDWTEFGDHLVNRVLKLERSRVTTQIEHYDNLAAFFDNLKRINTILMDLNRDIWLYIAMDYFKQKIKAGEVGSSAMPHKVNPIDFENSEGNLGVANAVFEHLSAKLPVSRLQRDLTDSTVTRNIGVPLAHTLIAFKSLLKGLDKLILNSEAIHADLQDNWAVVAEAVQTVLRREGYPEPYEALKELTRTHLRIDQKAIVEFIENLNIDQTVKEELKKITPHNYTGICDF
ncbi:MAG: adenylosuccinate lyase [Deltaproteobacteria bacterium]|nr:adenylosuccinate lyase [Deltaproteobacteria bacterium]